MERKFFSLLISLAFCQQAMGTLSQERVSDTPFYQGNILPENQCPAAYNAPALISVDGANVFAHAAFLYWSVGQDGMELASSGDLITSGSGTNIAPNDLSTYLMQPFSYSPGFKVGIGFGVQDWEIESEYTFIRQSTSIDRAAPTDHTVAGLPIWKVGIPWFVAFTNGSNGNFLSATHLSSKWRLHLDQVDLKAGRPYYQSKNITIQPSGGIRALWLREWMDLEATVPAASQTTGALSPQPISSHGHFHSWGVGPVLSAEGRCLIGCGFRLEGDLGVSVLFTEYTSIYHREALPILQNPQDFKSLITNYCCLRPMNFLGMGLSWGEYLYGNRYHIDLSAKYDFNFLWAQNMLQAIGQQNLRGFSGSNALFLHGLTLSGRFEF